MKILKILDELKIIINEVSENIETFQFNKSVAKIYEFVNILNDALLKNKLSQKNFKWSLRKTINYFTAICSTYK